MDYESKKIATFHFPIKKPDLSKKWIRFVNRINWKPTQHSVLCKHHFEKHFISRTQKGDHLKWHLNPVPTIYSTELLKSPSSLPTTVTKRKRFN